MAVDQYVQARPAPGLRPYVARYSGYRQRGLPPALHRGLPSPYLTLILTLDEPLVVRAHPDLAQSPGRYDTLLGGLHLTPALITHDGAQSGVQISIRPLGCRALLGLPAGELGGLDVDLAAAIGNRPAAALRSAVQSNDTWAARFAALDAALLHLRRDHQDPHPDLGYAYERILSTGGLVTVRRLAAEVGWSTRHLTSRFRAETGLGLKEAARVTRFDRARRHLRPGVKLSDLAAATGYFDQAHLARDFHAFAGVPPSRWLADEIGPVQPPAE
ncbi:helix-turn-helix domain-containing protein [Actinoplanes sp. NPDC049265]|uniref:AraC family transcriptional regulator n=1 Tax=Actinoplanes sp. NPDC049265 TaxID=3363902 RepID=UPI003710FA04